MSGHNSSSFAFCTKIMHRTLSSRSPEPHNRELTRANKGLSSRQTFLEMDLDILNAVLKFVRNDEDYDDMDSGSEFSDESSRSSDSSSSSESS